MASKMQKSLMLWTSRDVEVEVEGRWVSRGSAPPLDVTSVHKDVEQRKRAAESLWSDKLEIPPHVDQIQRLMIRPLSNKRCSEQTPFKKPCIILLHTFLSLSFFLGVFEFCRCAKQPGCSSLISRETFGEVAMHGKQMVFYVTASILRTVFALAKFWKKLGDYRRNLVTCLNVTISRSIEDLKRVSI